MNYFKSIANSPDIYLNDTILYEKILGSRRPSNYFWAITILVGAIGFLSVGISSYIGKDLLPFLNSEGIVFFPQGLVMSFYGVLGIFVSIYQWLVIFWKVGEGFNEFDRNKGTMRLFRWGFPGKDREIDIVYPLTEIQSIRVDIKEGLNPSRVIYVTIKGKPDIPLTQVGSPMALSEIEDVAAKLASFLKVTIEGL